MFVAVFAYVVEPGRVAAFEAVYGGSGEWARLFARATGYLGTDLLRDQADESRYLVVDRWESPEAYQEFQRVHGAEYAERSAAHATLYQHEQLIGRYDEVAP